MQYFGVRDLRENIGEYAQNAESGVISVISRNGKPLTVNFPFDDLLIELGAHKSLAVKLYEEGSLSLKKAARFAGLKSDHFIRVLGATGISVLGDEKQLANELKQFE